MIINFNKTRMVNQSAEQICLELKTDLLSITIESHSAPSTYVAHQDDFFLSWFNDK